MNSRGSWVCGNSGPLTKPQGPRLLQSVPAHSTSLCTVHICFSCAMGTQHLQRGLSGAPGLFSSHTWAPQDEGCSRLLVASCRVKGGCTGPVGDTREVEARAGPSTKYCIKRHSTDCVSVAGKTCVRGGLCKNSQTQLITVSVTRHGTIHRNEPHKRGLFPNTSSP